jgi:hypothetical protein
MNLMQKIYIGLFAILYLAVALISTIHAVSFFGLANNDWMSVVLAISFELGQAAVLFSLLTSKTERGKIMPWVLMGIFTLVQVLGNVYSSYKHIITSSSENLRFFKEPIFIWTTLPDDQATVIVTYIVGAILPICALLLTSMVTNQFQNPNDSIIHLEDEDVQKDEEFKNNEQEQNIEHIEENEHNEIVSATKNSEEDLNSDIKNIEENNLETVDKIQEYNIDKKPIKQSRFINSFN